MRQVRYSEQEYESAWLEWDTQLAIPDQILDYVREEYWVYDADVCGDDTFQFVVREHGAETYWEVEHAWWITYDPEWELHNEFDLKQIDSVQFEYPTKNRDWLQLIK